MSNNVEPVKTQYPVKIQTKGAGAVVVSRHRQLYQNIQLRIENSLDGRVEFVWIQVCDCPEGFYVEESTVYGSFVHEAAKGWIENWERIRYPPIKG